MAKKKATKKVAKKQQLYIIVGNRIPGRKEKGLRLQDHVTVYERVPAGENADGEQVFRKGQRLAEGTVTVPDDGPYAFHWAGKGKVICVPIKEEPSAESN